MEDRYRYELDRRADAWINEPTLSKHKTVSVWRETWDRLMARATRNHRTAQEELAAIMDELEGRETPNVNR